MPAFNLQEGNFKNAKKIQTDNAGNIYYQAGDYSTGTSGVVKLDVSNPNNIVKTDYLPFGDKTNSFAVSPEGHIVYNLLSQTGRIKKSNGGLYNIHLASLDCFYIGLDEKIKTLTPQLITTYTIDSNFDISENTKKIDGDDFDGENIAGRFSLYSLSANQAFLLYFTNKIFVMNQNSRWVYEIEGDNPHELLLPIVIRKVAKSNNFYYVSGNRFDNQNQPY